MINDDDKFIYIYIQKKKKKYNTVKFICQSIYSKIKQNTKKCVFLIFFQVDSFSFGCK